MTLTAPSSTGSPDAYDLKIPCPSFEVHLPTVASTRFGLLKLPGDYDRGSGGILLMHGVLSFLKVSGGTGTVDQFQITVGDIYGVLV